VPVWCSVAYFVFPSVEKQKWLLTYRIYWLQCLKNLKLAQLLSIGLMKMDQNFNFRHHSFCAIIFSDVKILRRNEEKWKQQQNNQFDMRSTKTTLLLIYLWARTNFHLFLISANSIIFSNSTLPYNLLSHFFARSYNSFGFFVSNLIELNVNNSLCHTCWRGCCRCCCRRRWRL